MQHHLSPPAASPQFLIAAVLAELAEFAPPLEEPAYSAHLEDFLTRAVWSQQWDDIELREAAERHVIGEYQRRAIVAGGIDW